MSEQTMQALVISVVDAVGVNPKPDWRRSLLDACDNVEAEYDELLAALERLNTETKMKMPVLYSDAPPRYAFNEDDAKAIRAVIAKAKGGE
jgi:hypothetical protein|tara:strand:+ start:269 stop:541 length:273 start_codon:yes stop_codon:yes gene_type:complete